MILKPEQIEARKERGLQIAKTSRIVHNTEGWKVPSQSGKGYYLVASNGHETTCNCPDCQTRDVKCKHIWAVEFIVTHEVDVEGNVMVKTTKKTYKQDWQAYDKAQINQKSLFMELLRDITSKIQQPEYKFGRPTLPMSDMVYSSIMKIFTTFSLRRFMSDMEIANEKGYITKTPSYASIGHFLQKEELTPLLIDMVKLTSLSLVSVESDFAIDSTGFGTTNFQRWYSFKHGKEIRSKKWLKCHLMTGVKTNIVTSVKVTSEFENDSPQLIELVNTTAEHFDMNEVSGDKAYLSKKNLNAIDELGATPYIPFKDNNKARGNGSVWKKMYYYFMLNNEEFYDHYHKRSNVESTMHMIKSKFGDSVRSKTWAAQVNEVLCKVICHNICVVIHEMFELGIKPNFNFCVESQDSVYKVGR